MRNELFSLISFVEQSLGPLDYPLWTNEGEYKTSIQKVFQDLGGTYKVKNNFRFLSIHYENTRNLEDGLGKRNRAYVHMNNIYAVQKAQYDDIVKLYDEQDAHFCSKMITQNWVKPLKLRVLINESHDNNNEDFITIPYSVSTILEKIPPNTVPSKFEDEIRNENLNIDDLDLSKIKSYLCKQCINSQGSCVSDNKKLFMELFGSFNLTLRALRELRKGRNSSSVDIIFSPIALHWNNRFKIIAALVGITQNKKDSIKSCSYFMQLFRPLILGLHHRDLLFNHCHKDYDKLKAQQQELSVLIKEIEKNKSQDIEKEMTKLKKKGLPKSKVEIQESILEERKKVIRNQSESFMKEVEKIVDVNRLGYLKREVEKWKEIGQK